MSFVDNRQFWTEFIQLYQSMRPLWDTMSKDYRNKRIRHDCYLKMVAKTRDIYPKATIEFVRRKIENLRASFRREFRKVERSKVEGDDVYQPQLWYFELMLFTAASDPNYYEGVSEAYPVKREAGETDEDDLEQFEDYHELYEAELLTDPSDSPLAAAVTEPSTARTPSPSTGKHPTKKKSRRDFQNDSDIFNPAVALSSFNEPYVFGQSVGLQLNEVDQRQKAIAEKVISEVLFHAKLGNLTESSSVVLSQVETRHCSTPTTSTYPT